MSLMKRTETSQVTVMANGVIFVQTEDVIEDDGVEIARTNRHRTPLQPGDDVSAYDGLVTTTAAAIWTPYVVELYATQKAARAKEPLGGS